MYQFHSRAFAACEGATRADADGALLSDVRALAPLVNVWFDPTGTGPMKWYRLLRERYDDAEAWRR
jgi:hypothetical protein